MNALLVAVFACLAALAASAPSGHGAIVAGPAGVVTGHGAIGPVGHGWAGNGWGWGGWGHGAWGHGGVHVQGPPTAPATISGPAGTVHADGLWGPTHAGAWGWGHGHGHGWW